MKITRPLGLILAFMLALSLLPPQTGSATPSPSITDLSPGDGSLVTSPIHISAQVQPGEDQLIRVTLLDRSNNILARKLIKRDGLRENAPIAFSTELRFEIPEESKQALLTLETQDRYHRPNSLRGRTLTLQSTGEPLIQSQHASATWLTITRPQPGDTLSGGAFTVEGLISPLTTNPVIFELITDTGGVIGTSQLAVGDLGQTSQFNIRLSYAFIYSPRDVRLVIRQRVNPFWSDIVLDSLPIILEP